MIVLLAITYMFVLKDVVSNATFCSFDLIFPLCIDLHEFI